MSLPLTRSRTRIQLTNNYITLLAPHMSDENLARLSMTSRRMRNAIAPILLQRMYTRIISQPRFNIVPPNTVGERRAIIRLANMGVGHRRVMVPMRTLNKISEFLKNFRRVPGSRNLYKIPNTRREYRLNRTGTLSTRNSTGRAPIRGVKAVQGGRRLALNM